VLERRNQLLPAQVRADAASRRCLPAIHIDYYWRPPERRQGLAMPRGGRPECLAPRQVRKNGVESWKRLYHDARRLGLAGRFPGWWIKARTLDGSRWGSTRAIRLREQAMSWS
jgi:hypothetical protein